MVNKRPQNAVLGYNLKNNRMISVHFQGKPFKVTVIQLYVPEAEVEWFCEVERVIPSILGKGQRFPGFLPLPIPWFLTVPWNCPGTSGCVISLDD